MDASLCRRLSDGLAKVGIAVILVGHVLYEVGQLVAGIAALEMCCIIDVVSGIHQPVGIEYHYGIYLEFAAAARNFPVAGDSRIAATLMRPIHLR
jgi:hypothetical protein